MRKRLFPAGISMGRKKRRKTSGKEASCPGRGGIQHGTARKTAGSGALFPHFGDLNFWLVAVLVFLVFFRPLVSGVVYPRSNGYFQILLVAAFCVFLLKIFIAGGNFYKTSAGVPVAAFLLWMVPSLFFSVYRGDSIREVYNFLGYAVLFMLAANMLRSERKKEVVLAALILSAAAVSLYAVYQYYWGLDRTRMFVESHAGHEHLPEFMSRLATQRAFSTFVYPPALAGFLITVFPPCLAMALVEVNRVKRLLLYAASVLALFALVLSFSKGGWLALVMAGILFGILWMKFMDRKTGKIATALLLLLAAAGGIAIVSGMEARAAVEGFLASYRVRYEYWQPTAAMISDYFLTGSGPGTWGAVYPEYKLLEAGETQMAHNNYIQVAVETGPLGLAVFLWIWVAVIWGGIKFLAGGRGAKKERAVVLGCISGVAAFLVQSAGEFTFYIPGVAVPVFFLAGVVLSSEKETPRFIRFRGGWRAAWPALAVVIAVALILMIRKPLKGDGYFEKARARLEAGDLPAAEVFLERAMDAFPQDASYYFHTGMLYEARPGFLDEAIRMYSEAVGRNPESSQLRYRLANALWEKSGGEDNEYREKALAHMGAAVSRYPFRPKYRVILGRMYHLAGMEGEAAREYRKALEYESGERMALSRQRLEEQLEEARRWLEEIDRQE